MNPYQYYSSQLPQQEPYYSHYEYNPYPQQDVYDPYQMDRQPALERRIAALLNGKMNSSQEN